MQQGAPAVYTLQVSVAGSAPTASEYQTALNTYAKFLPGVWRIVPADSGDDLAATIQGHVNLMSTVEERRERTAVYGKSYSAGDLAATAFSGTGGVLEKVGGFASGIKNKRVCVMYPDTASRTLSNGLSYDLSQQYIAAAIAGAESVLPTEQSRTRMTIGGFTLLKGVKMTRAQKNLLAEKGVMILDQETAGGNIVIRHGLTTDISSVQVKEASITAVGDYVSKYLRGALEAYIGKYQITAETLTMITASAKGALASLVKAKVITAGNVTAIMQDVDNPDTVAIAISIQPPYPCNYMDIVLTMD